LLEALLVVVLLLAPLEHPENKNVATSKVEITESPFLNIFFSPLILFIKVIRSL